MLVKFRLKCDREIDYITPKVKYNQKSITKEIKIKFRKRI